eukprot:1091076-Pelagomonas_calceolata.AAC.4
MSTSEKREKMVVWEAAISSSLIHPNIVQTYTYSINSVMESDKRDQEGSDVNSLGSAVQICGVWASLDLCSWPVSELERGRIAHTAVKVERSNCIESFFLQQKSLSYVPFIYMAAAKLLPVCTCNVWLCFNWII